MFIKRETYHAKLREAELEGINRSTVSYESRIADLKSQIEDLKKLIFIPKYEPSPENLEADSVLSNSEKPYEMSEKERNALLEDAREMDLIISGNYDEDLLQ